VAPGTPTAIIDKLNFEVRQVLQMADVRQRLQQLGGEPAASTPEEMRVRVEREVARWVRVVDSRKIERQ
jgi:tripartite-type tricarboxylate transporter receptor subunit TctC